MRIRRGGASSVARTGHRAGVRESAAPATEGSGARWPSSPSDESCHFLIEPACRARHADEAETSCARPLADRHHIGVEISLRPRKRERDRMENEFLTSGLACWNRQVKRAERASGPSVRLSVFTVDDQPQAPETNTLRGLHLCQPVFQPACVSACCDSVAL